MTKPAVSHRRIDHLRAIAFDLGFTNEDAKEFGKLSKTATWEMLLNSNGFNAKEFEEGKNSATDNVDTAVYSQDWTNDGSFPVCNFHQTSTTDNFLDWVDFSQLIALVFASVGLFVLVSYVWQYNPLKFLPSPIRITIQIGQK